MDLEKSESDWRQGEISKLFVVFYWINGAVLAFLVVAWAAETFLSKAPQIVSERSLLALIAGSTTQLGAVAYFVGRALVPPPRQPAISTPGDALASDRRL